VQDGQNPGIAGEKLSDCSSNDRYTSVPHEFASVIGRVTDPLRNAYPGPAARGRHCAGMATPHRHYHCRVTKLWGDPEAPSAEFAAALRYKLTQ
jgi:hypothetical protein